MTSNELRRLAARMIEADREDQALPLLNELLNRDPDDGMAIFMVGTIHSRAHRHGLAYQFFKRSSELSPDKPQVWAHLGAAVEGIGNPLEARRLFEKAHLMDPHHANYVASIALSYLHNGEHADAIRFAQRALSMEPGHTGATTTLGFAQLALGNWEEGWKGFEAAHGGMYRMAQDYGLPEWHGEPGCKVIVYGEQGIGDEIMYGTCLVDACAISSRVLYDADHRLYKLFRDSSIVSNLVVQGTRREVEKGWYNPEEWTHQCPLGRLPQIFRPTPASCPGTPYLKPNPDLRAMYDALIKRYDNGKTRVGICWTGGSRAEDKKKREMTLEALRPLIEAFSDCAEFFSLEYNDPAAEIKESRLPVHHHNLAVGKGAAYEHTAAYISCMDVIIGIHTAAHHAAGAMGIPTTVLVPNKPNWIYGKYHGDKWSWYATARLYRQGERASWRNCVKALTNDESIIRSIRGHTEGNSAAQPRAA